MGSYSRLADTARDPRRAYRIAQRIADSKLDPSAALTGPPGRVSSDAAGLNQLLASGINFDRAGFGFDSANYGPFTVNGISGAAPNWTKVAGRSNNLRVDLGNLADPVYVWIWATFGCALDAAASADHLQFVACLYDTYTAANQALCSAGNVTSDIQKADGYYHERTYLGFFGVDPNDPALLASAAYTGEQDWNVGLQMRYSGSQKVGVTSVNRQSIICFLSSYPPDGSTNYTLDTTLD